MWPSVRPALPLFLGAKGSGRSHLFHATCAEVNARDAAAAISPSISSEQLDPSMLDALESLPWSVSDSLRRSPATPCGSGALFDFYNRWKEKGEGLIVTGCSAHHARGCNCRIFRPVSTGVSFHLDELDDEGKLSALQLRAELRVSAAHRRGAALLNRLPRHACTSVCHPQSSRQRLLPCQAQAHHSLCRQRSEFDQPIPLHIRLIIAILNQQCSKSSRSQYAPVSLRAVRFKLPSTITPIGIGSKSHKRQTLDLGLFAKSITQLSVELILRSSRSCGHRRLAALNDGGHLVEVNSVPTSRWCATKV